MSMRLKALTQSSVGRADDANSKPNRRTQLLVVAVVALVVWFGYSFLNRSTVVPAPAALAAGASPVASVMVVTATPTSTVEPTWTPAVLYAEVTRIVEVEVTREVSRYIEGVPYEVTRVVEITPSAPVVPVVLPSPTPVPLAPGTVRVCADVQGARELYIGGSGVVAGECRLFSFGVGQTSIQVQVNN